MPTPTFPANVFTCEDEVAIIPPTYNGALDVETMADPLKYARVLFANVVLLVPPLPMPSAPDTCDVRSSVPLMVASVVVATQVGTPETSASTWPLLPAEVVAIAPDPLPRSTVFACRFCHPVPPPATVSVPAIDGVKVCVLPEPMIVMPAVSPLNDPVDVASVIVGPLDV